MIKVTKIMFLNANPVRNEQGDNIVIGLAAHAEPDKAFHFQISIDDADKLISELRDCIVAHENK
jgi:hypothetical protein